MQTQLTLNLGIDEKVDVRSLISSASSRTEPTAPSGAGAAPARRCSCCS